MKRLFILRRNEYIAGFTLVETLMAILVFAMVSGLALSTLFFFNRMQGFSERRKTTDQQFAKIQLYIGRALDYTDAVHVKDGRLYVLDMDTLDEKKTGKTYYRNYFSLENNGVLYRVKTLKDTYTGIGAGEKSQMTTGLSDFTLTAETDGSGGFTGNVILRAVFSENEDKAYETIMAVPGGSSQITLVQ